MPCSLCLLNYVKYPKKHFFISIVKRKGGDSHAHGMEMETDDYLPKPASRKR